MEDGRIGHVELIMGDALLMMADPFPEVDVEPPDASKGSAVSLHLEVPDCDAVAEAAVRNGVQLDRGPESTSHGRSATFRDPLGIVGLSTPEGPGDLHVLSDRGE